MIRSLIFMLILIPVIALGQDKLNTSVLKDLATPTSLAFIITDITPTLVQNPTTPKSFVLGIAQSFSQSSSAFPDNYSATFTPYWWIKSEGRDVYSFLGLSKPPVATVKTASKVGQNPFSSLKFSTLSVAFINKDLIPDELTTTQKAFSIGGRTTLLQFRGAENVKDLHKKLQEWHDSTLVEIADNEKLIAQIARLDQDAEDFGAKRKKILENYKETKTPAIFKGLNDLINVKPIFSWDVATALAVYGIDDNLVKVGRAGIWSTLSTYLPLSGKNAKKSYFEIHASLRYLKDNYQKNDLGLIQRGDNLDYGGKAGFEFNYLSFGVESIYRYNNQIQKTANRTVGSINIKVADNIYINGTFGRDFAGPNKLISVFGLNWGIGKEQVRLPE